MDAEILARFASGFQPVYGASISIRPLRADDFEIEEAFLRGLSSRTRNNRLLGGARQITPEYVARLTRVDYPREFALAAVVVLEGAETLIGVARYALDPADGSCEFAIVVADAWQGSGLGRRLLERLIEAARALRMTRMKGYAFSTNSVMLGLARNLGFQLKREPDDATLMRMTLELATAH
jgi:acetyltransferase